MHLTSASLPGSLVALVSTVLAGPSSGSANTATRNGLVKRAAPDSPSGDYPPADVDCPQTRPTIRNASSLSDAEQEWLENRRPKTIDPMITLLKRCAIPDFDAEAFINQHSTDFSVVPNIGISVSGGGYRALMNGAGFLAAADDREAGSTEAGQIGGLLQAATYLSGLSGGSWLVGSMFANNYSTVTALRDGQEGSALWEFSESILEGPDEAGISLLNTADYWTNLVDDVDAKREAGYNVSLTDPWGRGLSYQLINDIEGGPAYTFSSIADANNFANADTPFPIVVSVERFPQSNEVELANSVVEFNPFEMGTFDPTFYGFVPTEYIGSDFRQGAIPDDGVCVRGVDQFGFVLGTSSSLFNAALLQLTDEDGETTAPGFVVDMITWILEEISGESNDVAVWERNPFRGYNPDVNQNAESETLVLVDGGMALENIPLQPLILPMRAVDVVFAVDSSADSEYSWPNGTAMRATYDRSKQDVANGTQFPAVPDAESFINLGLNLKPTFFGCDTAEFNDGHIPPLIVYVPNAPYSAYSNISTFQLSTEDEQMYDIIENGWNVATMGNATVQSDWPVCVACAILSRSFERSDTPIPAGCTTCFERHCWNGTTDSSTPTVEPTLMITEEGAGVSLSTSSLSLLIAVMAGLALL